MKPVFIFSTDSLTVLVDGVPYVVTSDQPQYQPLIDAIQAGNIPRITELANMQTEITKLLGAFGNVSVYGGHVTYKGETIHSYLVAKIIEAAAINGDITPMATFLDNVMLNPDARAREGLYDWCEIGKLPITPDGCIIAYKIVGENYMDIHSGRFDNHVGQKPSQARGECDPNPDQTCSRGLHFCSAEYLPHYGNFGSGSRVMLVKIHPSNVVAFPRDYNLAKGRACEYEVIEEIAAGTAAQFFTGKPFVYSTGTEEQIASNLGYAVRRDEDGDIELTLNGVVQDYYSDFEEAWAAAAEAAQVEGIDEFCGDDPNERLVNIEAYLGIVPELGVNRLSHIETQLGLTEGDLDFDARLDRAETILHIN